MTDTQIKIEENGEWKATVNVDELGNVVREWGEGDDIEKIVIIRKEVVTDEQKEEQRAIIEARLDELGDVEIPDGASSEMVAIFTRAQKEVDSLRIALTEELNLYS